MTQDTDSKGGWMGYMCAPWTYVPWHIAEGDAEVRSRDGWIVCTTSSDVYARVIAAAPALVEALRALLLACEEADELGELHESVDGEMLDAAHAALQAAGVNP